MIAERALLRIGEYLVGRACRQLPRDIREQRYQEWMAELPAILRDPQIGPAPRRAVRMLGYAADTLRGAVLTHDRARPLLLSWSAVYCVLLVADLVFVTSDIWNIVGRPGDPLNYLLLAWGALLFAWPISMLKHSALRVSTLIASGSLLAGVAVNLWQAAQAPADWANYFFAAVFFLFFLTTWIVVWIARRGPAPGRRLPR
jgi:hypothetical protein